MAQDTPPPAAAPAEAAPARAAARTAEAAYRPEPGVSKQNNVNVRGQAAINSEVVARLQKNQPITLLEEITLKKPKQDEPARWYRIALPPDVGVWVQSSYVDADSKKVKPRRLNIRSGPGENYSVLGRLEQGAHRLVGQRLELKHAAATH